MIYQLTSKSNSVIKETVQLYESKVRNEKKLFICEGFHMLEEAKKYNAIAKVFTLEKLDLEEDQYILTKELLGKLSKSVTPQGVLIVCKMPGEKNITSNKVLYLDGISDPGNMGTLLRTALAFNFLDVIVSKDCVSTYNEKVIQASQGAIFQLNIVKGNIDNLELLKEKNYQIISTGLKSSIDIVDINPPSKLVLVLGNEAKGVGEDILSISTSVVRISMSNIDSLNVGVAGGIAMNYFK